MAKLGFCMPCGEKRIDVDAVVMVDGDPMCATCAWLNGQEIPAQSEFGAIHGRLEAAKPVIDIPLCTRGCNQPRHRGNCLGMRNGGQQEKPPQSPVEDLPIYRKDPLHVPVEIAGGPVTAERVRFEDIPTVVQFRHPQGRLGVLWTQLCECPSDAPVLKVKAMSIKHAGSLMSQLRGKGRRMKQPVEVRRDGPTVYVWLVAARQIKKEGQPA